MLLTNQQARQQWTTTSRSDDWIIEEAEKLSIALAMAREIERTARERIKSLELTQDEELALWSLLDSKERAALKRRS